MKNYKYNINKKIVKNPLRFINKITISNSNFNSMFNEMSDSSFDEIVKLIKDNNYPFIELIDLNQDEVEKIINASKDYLEVLELFRSDANLSSLNNCIHLKEVHLKHLKTTNSLWNLKNNKNIQTLVIFNCPSLKNIDGIKESSLINLEIKKDYQIVPEPLEINISDFNIFTTLKNLKNLTIYILENENKKEDLKALSQLTNLENLKLPRTYFTFSEFAWLKSRLTNTSGIGAIYHIGKDPANEKVYSIIIGKDKPEILYYDDVDYKIYNDEYDELIAKYTNLSIDELYE